MWLCRDLYPVFPPKPIELHGETSEKDRILVEALIPTRNVSLSRSVVEVLLSQRPMCPGPTKKRATIVSRSAPLLLPLCCLRNSSALPSCFFGFSWDWLMATMATWTLCFPEPKGMYGAGRMKEASSSTTTQFTTLQVSTSKMSILISDISLFTLHQQGASGFFE